MALGYVFWLIMSRIATPEMIGSSSAVASLGSLFAAIASIGVYVGAQRFIGKSFSEQKLGVTKLFVKVSLLIVSVGIVGSCISIFIIYNWVSTTFRLDFSLIIVTMILLGATVIMTLLRSIVIASMKIRALPIMIILSSIVKIVLSIILVSFDTGALGISISLTIQPIIASILLAITIVMIFRSIPTNELIPTQKGEVTFVNSFKNTLIASTASWIPTVIHSMGYYLGPLLVFGSIGASQTGLYFIAYSVFTAISALMLVLFSISYPVLSAMQDGRKRFAWRAMKMSLIVCIPLSSSLTFYSEQVMQLFGQDYVAASPSLEILLLSMLPLAFVTGINTLANASGSYKQVLIIGLASNVPSVLLYFLLLPLYHSITGAAISFTAGYIIGFIVAIFISRNIRMRIFWKDLAIVFALPTGIAFSLSHLPINYLVGISITLVTTYFLLFMLHIITRDDVCDSIAIIPYSVVKPLLTVRDKFYKKR
jgi:O-antigen/teichoic acid export membrane protein